MYIKLLIGKIQQYTYKLQNILKILWLFSNTSMYKDYGLFANLLIIAINDDFLTLLLDIHRRKIGQVSSVN